MNTKEKLLKDYSNVENELIEITKRIKRQKLIINLGFVAIVIMFISIIVNIITREFFFILIGIFFNIVNSFFVYRSWKMFKELSGIKRGLVSVKKSINRLIKEVENGNTNSI